MISTKVPLRRLASLSLTRITGMQMKYASAALKPFYSDTRAKGRYLSNFTKVAGCVPMWGMGFFINGGIMAELGANSSYLAIFGSSFVISVTSMVVVIYQLHVGINISNQKDPAIENSNSILQLGKYDSKISTKFQLTTWKGGDIIIDTESLTLIPRPRSLKFQLQDKENPNPGTFSSRFVTNKPLWDEFTSTIPIDVSLGNFKPGWYNFPSYPMWKEHPTFLTFVSSSSATFVSFSYFIYTCYVIEDEKYIIPNLWLCQGGKEAESVRVEKQSGQNILLCEKCSMTWNLDELSLPIRSENGANSFQLTGKEYLNPERALLQESIFRSILDTNKLPSKCLP